MIVHVMVREAQRDRGDDDDGSESDSDWSDRR